MARWRQKPAIGSFDVDWTHPSAQKLLLYLPFTEQGRPLASMNLASPSYVTTLTFPISCVASGTARYGGGIHTFSGGAIIVTNPGNTNAAAGDFMVRVLIRPVSWTSGFTEFISKGSGGRELCLFADTSGNLSFYGVGGGTGSISTATGMTAGQDWDFVWARKGTLNTAYVNGAAKGTWTDGSTGQQGASAPWAFGNNNSGGGSNADITYAGIQFWQRAPYPGEVLALYTDPFGLLRRRIARRYALLTTPAVPIHVPLGVFDPQLIPNSWFDTSVAQ